MNRPNRMKLQMYDICAQSPTEEINSFDAEIGDEKVNVLFTFWSELSNFFPQQGELIENIEELSLHCEIDPLNHSFDDTDYQLNNFEDTIEEYDLNSLPSCKITQLDGLNDSSVEADIEQAKHIFAINCEDKMEHNSYP